MAGIYLHIPFCKQACFYCDFHFAVSLKNKDDLLKSMAKELILRKDYLENQPIETIYFGGGTPSLLSTDEILRLFDTLSKNYNLSADIEFTLEANPDDLTTQKVKEFSNTPINRFSIGIQSFFDDDLKFMNRAHTASEADTSVKRVQDAGFDNITIDLIYGIPKMSTAQWKENLHKSFELSVPHLSCYALTVEEKTALHHLIKTKKYPAVSDEMAYKHFQILAAETAQHNFVQYELSNFGKEGYFSKHNRSYWMGKSYLGVGPSAHSFNGFSRSWNMANNPKYIKSIEQNVLPLTTEMLTVTNQFNEYLMTGLRTIFGVSPDIIKNRFGVVYKNHLLKQLEKHLQLQHAEIKEDTVFITSKGRFLTDTILSDLFFD
ncbi:MAG: radical SAM family heme chaperone HemW [Flavobacteriaceae bacterium]|nr:radical SAM family heme chaperone HemW [Flavobacteriaceae bacterium]